MDTNSDQVVLTEDTDPNISGNYYGSSYPQVSYPQGSYPANFTEFDDQLYFTANDGQSGSELFVSDGTKAGTQLVKDLVLGSSDYGYPLSSTPYNLIEFNNRLYFTANNGQSGNELWATDGTSSGTQLVADIYPGNYDSNSDLPRSSYPRNFVEFSDRLFFTANDGESGNELFVSDGTDEGTQLLADINPGSNNYGNLSSYVYGFTEFNEQLYFTANDGENGNELWVTDGTAEGTQLLVDLSPGANNYGSSYGSYPRNFIEFNDKLYFSADDGESGRELFVSDGTAEGTQLLVDLRSGTGIYGYNYSSDPNNFIEFNDKLYFTADNGESGNELFVSDGTAEGTQLLADIRPGSSDYGYNYGSFAANFVEFDNKLYFTANDGESGNELWVSDGTAEGTQLLADIHLGSGGNYNYSSPLSSYVSDITEFQGKLYFTAEAGEIGRELWVSDGTTEGTKLVEDLSPGNNNYTSGSYPSDLTVIGDELFFAANNGATGTELFKLTADGETIVGFDLAEGDRLGFGDRLPLDQRNFEGNTNLSGEDVLLTSNGLNPEQPTSPDFGEI
jgi:ELWxxDGT repeat protein